MTIAFITSQTSLISWFKNALARIQWDLRSRYCVHSISHLLFSRHRINVGPDPCRKGSITGNETKTPTHTTPGGACPTLSAQCGPICTRNPSQPQRPLPLAFITPVAWSGERPSLHRKNLQEETSLWDNRLRRYLCPVSRLCRPTSVGLALIAPSWGVESLVPTVHILFFFSPEEIYVWRKSTVSPDFFPPLRIYIMRTLYTSTGICMPGFRRSGFTHTHIIICIL